MPINKSGGNRAKKQGRKHAVSGGQDQIVTKTRFAKDKDEVYGAIIKEFGNGRALVKCIDGTERLLHIRKKFKGRLRVKIILKVVFGCLLDYAVGKVRKLKENMRIATFLKSTIRKTLSG